jgi:small subunit ribosomal protein S1
VLSVGETVKVQVTSIESQADGKPPKVGLSMKALQPGGNAKASAELEIVTATVDKVENYGVLVSTPGGAGLIPNAELDMPPGSDPRRRYKVGTEVEVVAMRGNAQGKLRFSVRAVAQVEERKAFANFRQSQGKGKGGGKKGGSLGSLGDLLAGIDLSGGSKKK